MHRHKIALSVHGLRSLPFVGRPPEPLGLIEVQAGARSARVPDALELATSPWASPPAGRRPWGADLAMLIPDGFPGVTGPPWAEWLHGLVHSCLRAHPEQGMLVPSGLLKGVRLDNVRVVWVASEEAITQCIPLHWSAGGPRAAELRDREAAIKAALNGHLEIERDVDGTLGGSLVPFTLSATSGRRDVLGRGAVRLVDGSIGPRDARLALALTRSRAQRVATTPFWYEGPAAIEVWPDEEARRRFAAMLAQAAARRDGGR